MADAVEQRVFLYAHKEAHLAEVQAAVPAHRYVMFEDKAEVLATVKRMDPRVKTVHVRLGHYGQAEPSGWYPAPDRSLQRIGDLLQLDLRSFVED